MLRAIKKIIESLVPGIVLSKIRDGYHLALASFGAFVYSYPARYLLVVGVTGTKGKTTVTEMLNTILEEAGYATCLINSIRFKIGETSERNNTRMTMPGRFFIQRFLHTAVRRDCTAAIIEMTSEGAQQYRHRFIDMDALIFLNLAPEHIESHGSFTQYGNAKFEIGRELVRSRKRPRIIVAHVDDKESPRYLTLPVELALPFSLSGCTPFFADERGGYFTFGEAKIEIHLPGEFSLKNALAAATLARALPVFGGERTISIPVIARALNQIKTIPGRAEMIDAGQDFTVVVDYAHTPDSLAALYSAYKGIKKICVLGAAGGGRDTWKRPIMGAIAEEHCDTVILTNEDPFDEDPRQIAEDIAHGMSKHPTILLDRREAIRYALEQAYTLRQAQGDQNGYAVLITGKGTDVSIAEGKGKALPWSDAEVTHDEIGKLLGSRAV